MLTPRTPQFRWALAPALVLAAMVPLTTAAQAGAGAEDIVVTSPEKMKVWQAETTRTLNRALEREPRRSRLQPSSGIVQLTFELGANGEPENVKVYSESAGWNSVRTAQRAVKRLGDLSDVPVTNAGDATFIANIIFANGMTQYRELSKELAVKERARLASGRRQGDVIVLGG